MTFQEIQQFLKARVDEFPIGIKPLAVLLVEGAVQLSANVGVFQGHTAAKKRGVFPSQAYQYRDPRLQGEGRTAPGYSAEVDAG